MSGVLAFLPSLPGGTLVVFLLLTVATASVELVRLR